VIDLDQEGEVDSSPKTAEQIRLEMRGIRRELRANVKDMVANASQMFDWKSYVRSFPWPSIAIAAVLGYVLVPRRMKVVAYDKATLENFLRENRLVVAPPPEKRASTVWGNVLPILGGVAVRLAMSYATRLGTQVLEQMTHQAPAAPGERPAPGGPRRPAAAKRNF